MKDRHLLAEAVEVLNSYKWAEKRKDSLIKRLQELDDTEFKERIDYLLEELLKL